MAASEDYLRGGDYDTSNLRDFIPGNDTYNNIMETAKSFRDRIDKTASFERLSVRDCIQAYSTQYVSTRGDLLLVQNRLGANYFRDGTYNSPMDSLSYTTPSTFSEDYFDYSESRGLPYVSLPITYPSYEWMCPSGGPILCDPNPDLWKPYGDIVQYCWSEKATEFCETRFSLYLAFTVIICNFVKVISMFMTFKTHKHGALITLRDAIESFLDKEDQCTRGLSICSTDCIQLLWNWKDNQSKVASMLTLPCDTLLKEMKSEQWERKCWYWGSAATRKRWAVCFAM